MATLVPDARGRAFERLYRRYVEDVYRYVLAVLRNPADAEDVTQTTFLNAYRAYLRGEEPVKPQHWLITIAHNACRTRAIRASRRPREVPLEHAIAELAMPEQERPNVREVLQALDRLPFNQRSALAMRELEGRSYEEIADTLGVSVSAVETLIFRARRSLRLRRDALRGLTSVSAPASLQSFGGGAVAQATGGLALGGLAVKGAAVVAAIVVGTAGFELGQAGVTNGDSGRTDRRAVTHAVVELALVQPFRSGPRADGAQVRASWARATAPRHERRAPKPVTPRGSAADTTPGPVVDTTPTATAPASPGDPERTRTAAPDPATATTLPATLPPLPAVPSVPQALELPPAPTTVPLEPAPLPTVPSVPSVPPVPSLPDPPPLP